MSGTSSLHLLEPAGADGARSQPTRGKDVSRPGCGVRGDSHSGHLHWTENRVRATGQRRNRVPATGCQTPRYRTPRYRRGSTLPEGGFTAHRSPSRDVWHVDRRNFRRSSRERARSSSRTVATWLPASRCPAPEEAAAADCPCAASSAPRRTTPSTRFVAAASALARTSPVPVVRTTGTSLVPVGRTTEVIEHAPVSLLETEEGCSCD